MKPQQETHIVAFDNPNSTNLAHANNQQLDTRVEPYPTQQHAPSDEKPADVRDVLSTLGRKKWLIFGIASLFTVIAMIISLAMTPVYRAAATIKIDPDEKKLFDFDVKTGNRSPMENKEFMQTQYKLLKSRTLARRVIDTLELEASLLAKANNASNRPFYADFMEDFNAKMEANAVTSSDIKTPNTTPPAELEFLLNLDIKPVVNSQLVNIYFTDKDPELAAAIVNNLTAKFIEMNLDSRRDVASDSKNFLLEQISQTKSDLEASEKELVDYERKYNIANTGKGSTPDGNSYDIINNDYTRAKTQRIDAEAAYRQQQNSAGEIRILDNLVIQQLKSELQTLQNRYQQDLQQFKPQYPAMVALRQRINTTQQSLNREINTVKQSTSQDLKKRFDAARQKEQELSKERERERLRLLNSRDKNNGHVTIQREVQTNRELYEGLLQRVKEVSIAGGVGSSNISIIDPALIPFEKHKPNTKLNMALGLVLGTLIGGLLALLLDTRDDRIRSVDDLKKLTQLPVLGVFPNTKVKSNTRGKRQPILVTDHPSSAMSEAFRSLRTNMLFSTSEGIPKLLHLTSSGSGEGKSNTAINLACVFAQTGKNVLIIDADLRKPSLHKYLKLSNQRGLCNYLDNEIEISEIESETSIEGLTAITSGGVSPNPADQLSSDKMVELLRMASDAYDLVIIDSPPVMGLADALILSNRSTATLFIVSSHEARKSHILGALERLRMGYGNVIGFVLTKSREGKKSGYGYDYEYGNSWAKQSNNSNLTQLEQKS
ncbi:MAG: Capsular exopolysaccharide family [uncultured Thiotrichaceae bacterium]|uniref:non-specific protein-tyrosine kinase n=1 Tax=uncultured Thiotrichaceae bacterium TaxID=298394 RepID=A0A6S6TXS6_9GAMM|nr:MAG: Capsular exopolysaccharide family [uncultured Thiotrichaceae bacterium]